MGKNIFRIFLFFSFIFMFNMFKYIEFGFSFIVEIFGGLLLTLWISINLVLSCYEIIIIYIIIFAPFYNVFRLSTKIKKIFCSYLI